MTRRGNAAKRAARAEHRHTAHLARGRDGRFTKAIGAATEIADQPPLIAIGVATVIAGAAVRRGAIARMGVRMLAAHLLATGAKTLLKGTIDRTRPAKALRDGHRTGSGRGTDDPAFNSFPSGHTAGAVAVGEAIVREMPGAALPVRAAVAVIGAAQLPRGKHYVSDVVAGAAIGWLAERIASAAIDALEVRLGGLERDASSRSP